MLELQQEYEVSVSELNEVLQDTAISEKSRASIQTALCFVEKSHKKNVKLYESDINTLIQLINKMQSEMSRFMGSIDAIL